MSDNVFGRIVRLVARRPIPVLALTLVLALGGAALALRLEPSAATDTLVSRSSDSFRATERLPPATSATTRWSCWSRAT